MLRHFPAFLFLLTAVPLGAASLTVRSGYTETTTSETCADFQLTWDHAGLETGVRWYDRSVQTALSYTGHHGKHLTWNFKGEGKADRWGNRLDTEATIGPCFRTDHWYGDLRLGMGLHARFLDDMDKPLGNTTFAFHTTLGMQYGRFSGAITMAQSTLFLYSYQWFTPVCIGDVRYELNDRWLASLQALVRINDAAPNELHRITLVSFTAAMTRRFEP